MNPWDVVAPTRNVAGLFEMLQAAGVMPTADIMNPRTWFRASGLEDLGTLFTPTGEVEGEEGGGLSLESLQDLLTEKEGSYTTLFMETMNKFATGEDIAAEKERLEDLLEELYNINVAIGDLTDIAYDQRSELEKQAARDRGEDLHDAFVKLPDELNTWLDDNFETVKLDIDAIKAMLFGAVQDFESGGTGISALRTTRSAKETQYGNLFIETLNDYIAGKDITQQSQTLDDLLEEIYNLSVQIGEREGIPFDTRTFSQLQEATQLGQELHHGFLVETSSMSRWLTENFQTLGMSLEDFAAMMFGFQTGGGIGGGSFGNIVGNTDPESGVNAITNSVEVGNRTVSDAVV